MAQVASAKGAEDLCPSHEKGVVLLLPESILPYGSPKTRPTGPGVEFLLRAEKLIPTAGTNVLSLFLQVMILPSERGLSSLFSKHVKLFLCQDSPPLFLASAHELASLSISLAFLSHGDLLSSSPWILCSHPCKRLLHYTLYGSLEISRGAQRSLVETKDTHRRGQGPFWGRERRRKSKAHAWPSPACLGTAWGSGLNATSFGSLPGFLGCGQPLGTTAGEDNEAKSQRPHDCPFPYVSHLQHLPSSSPVSGAG